MSALAIRTRREVHDFIVDEGKTAVLRNASGDRPCLVIEEAYLPNEIDGNMIQRGDRRFFLSALTPALVEIVAPDAHSDRLVLSIPTEESDEIELLFATPPVLVCPGDVIVYFELHCREP